ncbi:hypothetical protein DICVIV_02952 [Dictyocaulus viviparus]|uniref:Uncharacterized protein n=1 Tax=Dictyocaulus viviparus TaxID=29172 RepID=A0A0D8Y213_DICVI|nr:hypothetical protein DICVIV_02952 [Dictyocaulus viviparus]
MFFRCCHLSLSVPRKEIRFLVCGTVFHHVTITLNAAIDKVYYLYVWLTAKLIKVCQRIYSSTVSVLGSSKSTVYVFEHI